MDFTVKPATSALWPALEDLFGRPGASNGCWCMYWRIGPRYRDRPRADNKEDLRRLAASGSPPGLLAFDGDRAVGWCELAPRAELAWLARTRYLGPVDDLPVWSVPCFYVRSSHRGRGVMDALIGAALPAAAAAGAPALEAYPVDTTVPSHTGNLFPGIAAAFARHGFEVVARRKYANAQLAAAAERQIAAGSAANPAGPVQSIPTSAPPHPGAHAAEAASEDQDLHKITSPIVGTFYRAPAPTADSFVRIGSQVEPATVVCIIEAMKLMNEIQAETTGEVVKIYVENGQAVEYGQPLFGIKR